MSKEHSRPCFQFTEREKLYDRISHKRFMEIVEHPDIDIYEVKVSLNSFGEYLFVLLRCRAAQAQTLMTFWGLGYHEHRERWISDNWQWYESQRGAEPQLALSKQKVIQEIQERVAFVEANKIDEPQSERATLYDLLADLTDEDGALSDLDDLNG